MHQRIFIYGREHAIKIEMDVYKWLKIILEPVKFVKQDIEKLIKDV